MLEALFVKPNPKLKVKLNISDENFAVLEKLYAKVTDLIVEINNTKNYSLANDIETLEEEIQKTWGFTINPNMRYFTFLCDDCKCPQMDNQDARGIYRIFNTECPVHSQFVKE